MKATTKELYESAALHSADELYALLAGSPGAGFTDAPAEGATEGGDAEESASRY